MPDFEQINEACDAMSKDAMLRVAPRSSTTAMVKLCLCGSTLEDVHAQTVASFVSTQA